MVLTNCWRCLRTPQLSPSHLLILPRPLPRPQSASFTTNCALLAKPAKKAPQKGGGQGNQKTLAAKQRSTSNKFHNKKSKKDIVAPKRVYQDGQRKVIKKTIVLSNTNAPAITLPVMTPELVGNKETEGTVFEIPGTVIDKLRCIEAFKTGQHWPYFQKPSTLLRKESIEVGELISGITNAKLKQEKVYERRILDGTKGSGRSIVLAQAMIWAFQSGWIVISIPNAQDLVIGHTEYELDPRWNLWIQKEYTSALLSRIYNANTTVLRNLKTAALHKIGKLDLHPLTLLKLVDVGIQDPNLSHDTFMALLKELSNPTSPPVLFTLDNLNQISSHSTYRDPSFAPIHAHDLALASTFLSYLNGTSQFQCGLTLAATSSISPRTPALTMALKGKAPGPWDKIDRRIAGSVAGAGVITCEPLKREEVKILLDWNKAGGVYKGEVTLESVAEMYALSSGNPRELFRECLRLKY